jgi:hypothetical protein
MSNPFEEFWNLYPRRIAKKAALKSYLRALKDTTHAKIIEGVKRYASYCNTKGTEPQFIAHPATWLNQGRWDDELDAGGGLGHAIASAIGERLGLRRNH